MAGADSTAAPTESWQAACGPETASLMRQTSAGVELLSAEGDTWGKDNSQRAVFVRPPKLSPPYALEATLENFVPQSDGAQAGLVAWGDADNYVRVTAGFRPNAFECLGEIDAQTTSCGHRPLFPDSLTSPVRLRMEVLETCVRGYASYDGKHWLQLGGITLPKGKRASQLFRSIGLIGVGAKGGNHIARFTGIAEQPVSTAPAQGNLLERAANCMLAQGNSGWGREAVSCKWKGDGVELCAFSGADIFFTIGDYPFLALPCPETPRWDLQLKIRGFDPAQDGEFPKAGLVLWQDNSRFLNVSVVADKQFGQLYIETLAKDSKGGDVSSQWAWTDLAATDVYLKISRVGPELYQMEGSYDGKTWHKSPPVEISLSQPQLRAFVSGDVFMQFPKSQPHATFEYLNVTAKETN